MSLESDIEELYYEFYVDIDEIKEDTPLGYQQNLLHRAMNTEIDRNTLKQQLQHALFQTYWTRMTRLFEGREAEAFTSPSPFVRSLYQAWRVGFD